MGLFQTRDALKKADDFGFDLVEISPNARPPVCKIMDYGKYKYEQSKKKHEAKKKQVKVQLKEIKMRPSTGEHDLQVKIGHIKRFFADGNKAKITVRFRGREMARMDMGRKLLDRIINELSELGDVDQYPKREGRAMSAVLTPKK